MAFYRIPMILNTKMYKNKMIEIVNFIKRIYSNKNIIPLHEPHFSGNEKNYVIDCIDSTFVSSVGKYVERFEIELAKFVSAEYAVATVNGTSALHIALKLANVHSGDEVVTQPLTFVATCNAIHYCGADPIFVDVDLENLGMSPESLKHFLEKNCILKDGYCINKVTSKIIKACVPMHTFGHPCRIEDIKQICNEWHITLVEDAAESLGSFYKNKHTGTFGKLGIFSFNGNKIITSGGGGAIVTNDETLAKKAKHLTTTAKIDHPWEYVHDEVGYNYRMPNINAALLVAQLEQIDKFLSAKRKLAVIYKDFFSNLDIDFIEEPKDAKSNYWLFAIKLKDKEERDQFLEFTNNYGIKTRPIWKLMSELNMYKNCQKADLKNAKYLEERIVNIPSSVIL